MINYYDLSTEKNTNKISVSLVFKRVLKCTLIIMPTLLFSSVASAKDVVKIVKTSKKLSKSEKALLIVIKTSGLYIGGKACTEEAKKATELTQQGPIFPLTATTCVLCGAFIATHVLEDQMADVKIDDAIPQWKTAISCSI
ncbi:unknown (chloroplast) [Thalassiosira oceanica CCMP1005]|uniref:Uncharacterized protein n=1 Tax=Thalassiosira oceanica TaxID=159749 RepID=A0ACA6S2L2_THAOC|nr:hypothetical protein THAOCp072 [Thalassiosira oceanica CCMP1005]ADB27619.1 unknown [Thalassiosira oceanica CCMP1005]|eukprot:ADB27619.1 unknown (chloroplast) [Thalassiosira oceanica CCMP1005]